MIQTGIINGQSPNRQCIQHSTFSIGVAVRDCEFEPTALQSPFTSATPILMPCALCDDTGWKSLEANGARRVVRCDCWREGLAARLLDEARIPPRYRRCDLETFVTYPNEKLLTAVKHARRFADEFPNPRKGLCLIGPPGIGKTHLAVSILRDVIIAKGARGLFYDVRD